MSAGVVADCQLDHGHCLTQLSSSIKAVYRLGSDARYFIRYGVESWLGDVDEDGGYSVQVEGIVLCSSADGDDGTVCGRMRAYILKTEEMIENGKFDIDAWADEDELDDVAKAIYTTSGAWSDEIKSEWPNVESMDVIVIEDIFIEKPHRRLGLGLVIADRAISLFGRGCGLAVISPWPTEVENRGDEDEAKLAHGKIGKYSQRLGFRNVPGTDLWARSLEHVMERTSN